MKARLFLFLILCFWATGIEAQDRILLQGKITNEKDVEGIHILNTSSRYNSVTDPYGNFAITVRQNDTLIFSSVHYSPQREIVHPEIFEKGLLIVTLTELVNELDEVVLGPDLSGNLKTDIEKIPVKDKIDFDDVGLPGFKGKPEEKIPPLIGGVITPLSVNLEGLYNHLSGYYKKLRIQRKWDAQNIAVAGMLDFYSAEFLHRSFGLPENKLYDFFLFCIETSDIQSRFYSEDYGVVLEIIEDRAKVYVQRIELEKE